MNETVENAKPGEAAASPRRKKAIAAAVVVVVVVAAACGFWAWHEQPSFCGAICHVPMDEYLATYEQEGGQPGVDKYGNEVEDASAMLAVAHKDAAGTTCIQCHVPTLGEQVSEGLGWIAGGYYYPLYERDSADLVAARGLEADQFCLNESCHDLTRDDLVELTSGMEFNPHVPQHGEAACTDCHKAHRASVLTCTECHAEAEAELPEGWLTVDEEAALASQPVAQP